MELLINPESTSRCYVTFFLHTLMDKKIKNIFFCLQKKWQHKRIYINKNNQWTRQHRRLWYLIISLFASPRRSWMAKWICLAFRSHDKIELIEKHFDKFPLIRQRFEEHICWHGQCTQQSYLTGRSTQKFFIAT